MKKMKLSSFIGSFFIALVIIFSLFIQFQVVHGEIIDGNRGRRLGRRAWFRPPPPVGGLRKSPIIRPPPRGCC
ncbi:hypothetical protein DsansV1_C38g0234711 [Dioscorea sansibarensis]